MRKSLCKQLIDTGGFVDCIGGVVDHVQWLILLTPGKSIADVMKQIKCGSSHAFNQMKLTLSYFSRQTGYGAFSLSESHVPQVRAYILNQKEHHRTVTFMDEFNRLMAHYGLPNDDNG